MTPSNGWRSQDLPIKSGSRRPQTITTGCVAHPTIATVTDMDTATPKCGAWEPDAITARSFHLIEEELRGERIDPAVFPIVRRVIHATADFDFARLLCFHPLAIQAGVACLRTGATIITDVRMVEVGINQRLLRAVGGNTLCLVHDATMARLAEISGETRSAVAMRQAAKACPEQGVFVIGNAPTALRTLLRLVEEQRVYPALIVGVPVGFVGAAESKAALMALERTPWIASQGQKGGSAVAVAIVNALLLLAMGQDG
jgi:precorrin-8X/cobalt-precorrin-8 methylmutase